ncbi:MAG: hypothetical protein ABR608_09255 [Pseudonocardiaceae bacterium]
MADAITLGGDLGEVIQEEGTAVLYVLAALGAVTVTVLLWKAFGPQRPAEGRPASAPDDDPEFLRGLNRKRQEPNEEG